MRKPPFPDALRGLLRRLWPTRFLAQVILLTSAMIVTSIVALTAYTTTKLLEQQYHQAKLRLGAIANNLAYGSAQALLIGDQVAVEQLLLRAAEYPGMRALAITTPNSRILSEVLRAPGKTPEATFDYRELSPPRAEGTQYLWRYGDHPRGAWYAMGLDATALEVWHPIENGRLGWLRIETGVEEINADARHLIRDSALIALAITLISTLVTYQLLRPSLRAMSEATAFARRLAHSRGQHIPIFSGSAELAELGHALNETSARMYAQETARELAEHELRENGARMRFMLETCPTAARIARSGHEVIFFNSRYAELINAAPGKVSGVDPSAYYADRAVYEDILARLGRGEQIFDRLVELNIPGQGKKWALGSYLPIQYEGQAAVLGWFHDITANKRAEETLRDQAEHTQAILDHMVDGLITFDQDGIVHSFNPAAENIFGYAANEVLGRNVSLFMPNPLQEAHDGYLRNDQATGAARLIGTGREVEGRRKDGSLFPMELAVAEITRQGQPLYVGMARDISERKRVERMKSEFVSAVSHELRTPLTSISGALGLIAGGALGAVPTQARQMIDIAHKNSQRLTFLINDLLDMEKLVAGKMHFDLKPQPLMPLIEQALETNRTYGAERRVTLALTRGAPEVEVRVDPQRLMQVLSNLLSNAIKYSHEGGTVEVDITKHGNMARVTVTDHGTGIPAAFHDRIFQKFSQADSSDTRQKGGTGLGLAISRELVERMGGQIGFDSVEGEGARFFFDLPLWHAHLANPVIDPLAKTPAHAPRILVVEDEPDIAELLGIMLTRAGYAVDTVGLGEEALRALRLNAYAAMTLDLMLPDISGLEVIRRARSQPESMQLPIIVVSAKMEEGRLAFNGDCPGIDWLAKPVDESRLMTAVEHGLAGPGAHPPRVLHVEDDSDLHQVLRTAAGTRFEFDSATTCAAARARMAGKKYDVVILDLDLPDRSGWALLPDIRTLQPQAQVVILSGADISAYELRRVEAALLKSQITPHDLLNILSSRIRQAQHPGKPA